LAVCGSCLLGSLLVGGALYLQVVFLTTPFRNSDIGRPGQLAYQDVTLTSADGVPISGWYIPGRRTAGIVLVHGIHANRAYLLPQAEILAEAGYHLLLIDLRGHGLSGDGFVTFGYNEALDVQAGMDYLLAQPEIGQVALLGHSLGAAAVVRATADDERVQGLIVQSSYSSLRQMAADSFEKYAVLPKWPFAPLIIKLAELRTGLKMGQISSKRDLATMKPRPVLIIHSAADDLIPVHQAQQMYQAAQEPKEILIVPGLPHINPITDNEVLYRARMLAFFEMVFERAERID